MTRPFTAEVVGASGRMGTFWLGNHCSVSGADARNKAHESGGSAAPCPRGTTPGSLTPDGCPIYVATPSDAYQPIYESTPPNRRKDLVLVGNAGLPIDDRFRECTILVPHFSVLYQDQWKGEISGDATNKQGDGTSHRSREIRVDTDPLVSPPTYIYGNHATNTARILEANGISTEIVPSFREIRAYSGRKLLWASCFWLLCHGHGIGDGVPLTVGQVHEVRQDDLEKLVDEILPSLRVWLLFGNDGNETDQEREKEMIGRILHRNTVMDYLRAYSTSISQAVPSIDLAKQEFPDRNGVWLSNPSGKDLRDHPQPFHIDLLKKQGVDVAAAAAAAVAVSRDQ